MSPSALRLTVVMAVCGALAGAVRADTSTTVASPVAKPSEADLDKDNPVQPLPAKMLGHEQALADLPAKPDPEKVRLGRWLYFDKRMSLDGSISCATCHVPAEGFSEKKPVSTGIKGQQGKRKAPSFINAAFAFYPETFWDGRAKSLEDQAIGPMANPIEMGSTHEVIVKTISEIPGYRPFFKKAFGDDKVDLDRIAKAIADYERTRISGNSPYDKWKHSKGTIADDVLKLGDDVFFNKGKCSQCHAGFSFTDSKFHNIGVGYDEKTKTFADEGRSKISKNEAETGAFKTPGLRDVALHAPYMHDGSLATLEATIDHYDKGGIANKYLDPKMSKLALTAEEKKALVRFMEALTGEGYQDSGPTVFPQ